MSERAAPSRTTSVTRHVAVPPPRVFAALADGWMYPVWLVGAAHIRGVDDDWPAVGAKIHHQVGAWPLAISDSTEVADVDAPHRLVLNARAWPLGEVQVELRLEADGLGTRVVMTEGARRGPARWLDNPVQRWVLRRRNMESLDRLATLAEKRNRD